MRCFICGEKETVQSLTNGKRVCLEHSIVPKNIPRNKTEIEKECSVCGNKFVTKLWKQKFCSHDCSRLHFLESPDSAKGRFLIYSRDNFRCIYCGRTSYGDNIKLELEHLIPQTRGGESCAYNLVTSCSDCNGSKYNAILKSSSSIADEISKRNKLNNIHPKQIIKD